MDPNEPDPMKLWQHVHGASSHFPIALIIVAVLFEIGAVLWKKPTWRTVGFWAVIVAAVLAVPTTLSGLTGQLGWFEFDKWEAEHLILHRNVSLWGGGAILLLAIWRVVRAKNTMKPGELAAYLIALIGATGAIGYTGWLGAYVARGY